MKNHGPVSIRPSSAPIGALGNTATGSYFGAQELLCG
jgi:hypothetical protein